MSHGVELSGVAVWLLSFVLFASGAAKIGKADQIALALIDLRITSRARRAWAHLLIGIELTLSALLLIAAALSSFPYHLAVLVPWALTVMFGVFGLVQTKALVSGKHVPCMCFGRSDEVISSMTLVRALLLAGLSTYVAVGRSVGSDDILGGAEALVAVSVLGSSSLAVRIWSTVRGQPAVRASEEGTG